MKLLQWLIAAIVGLYGLWNGAPCLGVLIRKLAPDALPATMQRYAPLMDNISWPHEILWIAVTVLYLATAGCFTGNTPRARYVWLAAIAGDVALGIWITRNPAYQTTFDAGDRACAHIGLGLMAVCGLAIWRIERTPIPRIRRSYEPPPWKAARQKPRFR